MLELLFWAVGMFMGTGLPKQMQPKEPVEARQVEKRHRYTLEQAPTNDALFGVRP